MENGMEANKISTISITRQNSVDLHKALRKMLSLLTEEFYVHDIEYTADPNSDKGSFFSTLIIGMFRDGSYLDLNDTQTTDEQLESMNIQDLLQTVEG